MDKPLISAYTQNQYLSLEIRCHTWFYFLTFHFDGFHFHVQMHSFPQLIYEIKLPSLLNSTPCKMLWYMFGIESNVLGIYEILEKGEMFESYV